MSRYRLLGPHLGQDSGFREGGLVVQHDWLRSALLQVLHPAACLLHPSCARSKSRQIASLPRMSGECLKWTLSSHLIAFASFSKSLSYSLHWPVHLSRIVTYRTRLAARGKRPRAGAQDQPCQVYAVATEADEGRLDQRDGSRPSEALSQSTVARIRSLPFGHAGSCDAS